MKMKNNHGVTVVEAAAGAVAGAAIGSIAGPVGAIAGAAVGGVLGAAVGVAVEATEHAHQVADAKLDEEIGVYNNDLGAPNLEHPPAIIGAFSGGSSGAAGARPSHAPASGPMSTAESDD